MPPRLTHATLDELALRRILSEQGTHLTTIYLESQTRVVLTHIRDFLGPKITLPPVRWLMGRAFGPELEIRWHLEGDQFEATALTESVIGPAGWRDSDWNPLLDAVTKPRNMLLYGMNANTLPPDHALYSPSPKPGLWLDIRLPRPLNYPAPDPNAKRVQLRCLDYLSMGLVVLTRLCEMISGE